MLKKYPIVAFLTVSFALYLIIENPLREFVYSLNLTQFGEVTLMLILPIIGVVSFVALFIVFLEVVKNEAITICRNVKNIFS
jgi:hypothetical protein